MINTQQIIIMIPLFKIELPDNAGAFFGFLFPIAAFDIIDTGDFWDDNLGVKSPDAITDNFDSVGFGTTYFL
jgi:hypothetical protein